MAREKIRGFNLSYILKKEKGKRLGKGEQSKAKKAGAGKFRERE